ncbi:unnamed protein product, partial [Urochloa humidicola]
GCPRKEAGDGAVQRGHGDRLRGRGGRRGGEQWSAHRRAGRVDLRAAASTCHRHGCHGTRRRRSPPSDIEGADSIGVSCGPAAPARHLLCLPVDSASSLPRQSPTAPFLSLPALAASPSTEQPPWVSPFRSTFLSAFLFKDDFSGGRHGDSSQGRALLFVATPMHSSCLLYCPNKSNLEFVQSISACSTFRNRMHCCLLLHFHKIKIPMQFDVRLFSCSFD